ncbi:MAG: hypothetical protein ABIF40_03485 [archaeon]
MGKDTFQQIREDLQNEYNEINWRGSIGDFVDILERDPRLCTRTAFQMVGDMFDHFGYETYEHCGQDFKRSLLWDDPFDRSPNEETGKHAVYGMDKQLEVLIDKIQSVACQGGDERLIVLHGPPGTAKTSVIRLMMRGLEEYSRSKKGALYSFNWVFTGNEFLGDIGYRLPHMTSTETQSLANLKDEELFINVPCQMNDHPLMLLPKTHRRKYLENIMEENPGLKIPEILFENDLCYNCQTMYTRLLDKYEGDVAQVLKHVQVLRLFVSEVGRIGAATIQPSQTVDGRAPKIVQEMSGYQKLAQIFPGIKIHQFEGKWADGNRGIMHYTDIFMRPTQYLRDLNAAIQERIQNFDGVQATVDAIILATTNVEQLVNVRREVNNRPLIDRSIIIDIPYVTRISAESKIYADLFTKNGYEARNDEGKGKHVMPYVADFISLFGVLTRLMKPSSNYYAEHEVDQASINLIKKLSPIQKAQILDGIIPERLTRTEKALIKRPRLQRLISQEFDKLGVKITSNSFTIEREGMQGLSPRRVREFVAEVIADKEEHDANVKHKTCLGVKPFVERLEKMIKDDSEPFLKMFYRDEKGAKVEKRYLSYLNLLNAALIQYDSALQDDVTWAIIGLEKEKLDLKLVEYVEIVQAYVNKERVKNPITGNEESPDEKKMQWIEERIGIEDNIRDIHRNDIVMRLAKAYREIEQNFGAENLSEAPTLSIPELFADDFEKIYETLLDGSIEKMKIGPEEFLRAVEALDTNRFQTLDKNSQYEIDRILINLKQRAPYCDRCAKDTLKYVISELKFLGGKINE